MQANNETYIIYALRLEHLNGPNGVIATTFEYDGTQFPVKVTLPDGTASTAEYSIVEEYLKSVQTDANGHVTDSYKDIRGRDCKTVQHADGQEKETSFYHNTIGELLSVEHPNKEITTYEYDGLGSTSYITDRDGNATQFVCYKPYGEALVDEHATSFESPWKFNGKELDSETGLYYYGARYYEPVLALFYGTDRYTEKFPWQSAYSYAGENPIGNIDVNGDSIRAIDYEVQQGIINTLSIEEAKHVRFDENGILDIDLLKTGNFCSENYTSLLTLAESDLFYNFYFADNVGDVEFYDIGQHYMDKKAYSYGITLLPGAKNNPSPDNNVHIYSAGFLPCSTQVTNIAHEAYGHAYLYELSRYDSTINPNHTWGVTVKNIYDDYWKAYIPTNVNYRNNYILEGRIEVVTKQALDNYESRH